MCGFSLLTCRARSVEHKELILGIHPEGFRVRAGLAHQLMVPLVPPLPPHLLYKENYSHSTAWGLGLASPQLVVPLVPPLPPHLLFKVDRTLTTRVADLDLGLIA